MFRSHGLALGLLLVAGGQVRGQSEVEHVTPILEEAILSPSAAQLGLKQYILSRVAPPPSPASAKEWAAEAARIRRHLLEEVVFHGWPGEWVSAPPRFEDLGLLDAGPGYRLRKLRYEILPGFASVALLYEPERMGGRIPAVLNLNGHVGPPGKSVEYKQKRCINLARHGVMALNLEWLGFGELAHEENAHWFGAHLDLVGANALGLFYLEMRRGLDYLARHPQVDPKRLGVTGLSGGGWQTIVLSALDERVAVAVPVAGFSATSTKVEARRFGDLGDLEQNAPDLLDGQDYAHLVALRAPRPTLLINNAEDDCCFRGPLVRPLIFDAVKPVFRLFGREGDLAYHENDDPGTHNYQLDNRLAAYRFFSRQFALPVVDREVPAGGELRSYEELVVGLPKDNLTILGLARAMSRGITRSPLPAPEGRAAWAASERRKLEAVVRYRKAAIGRVWVLANTKRYGVETRSFLFEMGEGQRGLLADGVWFKATSAPPDAPATILLDDKGKKAAAAAICGRVNRGEQVLALDPLFVGEAWRSDDGPHAHAQILDALGDRTLGLQAAQLVAIARWLKDRAPAQGVRLETSGIRTEVVALVAGGLEPGLFSEIEVRGGKKSLAHLLEAPVRFQDAPELFCLDLYRHFDLDRLARVASPTKVGGEPLFDSAGEVREP
jgi:dienelactone hydrolase